MYAMDEAIPQDDMLILEPEDCDTYEMPEGKLLIGRCDQFVSQGFLDLNPGAKLEQSMPVEGMFKQISGSSLITVADNEQILEPGKQMQIPANTAYTIAAQGRSIVAWKYDGDMVAKFTELRKRYPEIKEQTRKKSGYKELFDEYQKRFQDSDAHVER